jgi:hypothetical protein
MRNGTLIAGLHRSEIFYKFSAKSRHSGLPALIKSSFFWREPAFSYFSRAMAALASGYVSKYTN